MFPMHGAIGRATKAFSFFSAAAVSLILSTSAAFAVPASPLSFHANQPDGTPVELRVRGDEHFNWSEDIAGYTVVYSKGWYEYARLNPQGRLVPSGLKVGHANPRAQGLEKGILPSSAQRAASSKNTPSDSIASLQSLSATGTLRNLVVLVQFANHVGRSLPAASEIDVLFNAPGGDPQLAPTGSIRDVYLRNSYGQLELNSDITAWLTVSGTEQYYANGESGDSTLWEALREALSAADAQIDFGQYDSDGDGYIDSITFLHSGFGAEFGNADEDGTVWPDRIWSHKWEMSTPWVSEEGVRVAKYNISPALWGTAGSRIGRIGVIAHEIGHYLGLPDLYDTDGGGSGIGSYGLMANSWGFDSTQLCPPQMSPWSKLQLGWIDPVNISQPGQYEIGQSATYNEYFAITAGYAAGEYLMIENRQRDLLDCALPQGGLAIWHIDDQAGLNEEGYPYSSKRWPRDGKHYRVALAQADGQFYLERGLNRGDAGDVHHAAGVDAMAPGPDGHPNTDAYQDGNIVVTGHTISDISAAGPVMTFCLNGCGDGGSTKPVTGIEAPSNLVAAVSKSGKGKSATSTVNLNWADNSGEAESQFVIERCQESGQGRDKSCSYSVHATVGRDVTSFSEPYDGSSYRYRVKARSETAGDSDYSNEVSI